MYREKIKLLDDLMDHLGGSQGQDLKSTLDESRKPKGLKVESIEVMNPKSVASNGKTLGEAIGYPGFKKGKSTAMLGDEVPMEGNEDDEPTDDEIEMLMNRYRA